MLDSEPRSLLEIAFSIQDKRRTKLLRDLYERDVQIARHARAGGSQAWAAFQSRRTGHGSGSVATPMTWPGCRRPPAGVTSLESDFKQRVVATAQPSVRAQAPQRRLEPIGNKKNSKARGSRHVQEKQQQSYNKGPWAQRWANLRSEQTNVLFKGMSEKDLAAMEEREQNEIRSREEHARWLQRPRKRREIVLKLNEKEAANMKQLRGVYANSTETTLRAERLRESIKALQDRTLHREINTSMKEYHKKVEVDKMNRSELKRVRDRFHKDKQRRTMKSHISLQALDSPQVSRQAYGLPEDGKEFEETKIGVNAEKRLQQIWQKAVKRTVAIDKFINCKTKHEVTLPKIQVKRHSSKLSSSVTPDTGQRRTSDNSMAEFQVALGELEALSSVGSDLEDNLTDIGEEDTDDI